MTDTIDTTADLDEDPPADLGPTGPEEAGGPLLDLEDTFDVSFDDTVDPEAATEPHLGPAPAGLAVAPVIAGLLGGAAPDAFPGAHAFRIGKAHPAVARLGRMLIARGGRRFYADGPGPTFTVADRNATAAFQRAQGFAGQGADGFPGPTTWQLLVTGKGKDIPRAAAAPRSPVPGFKVTFPFGVRSPRYRAGFHTGADYAAPVGTPIVAWVSGRVSKTGSDPNGYGIYTMISGDDGHTWLYAHQSRRKISQGERVSAGQTIGFVGSTGKSTGPHLHIEKSRGATWAYGKVTNPTV